MAFNTPVGAPNDGGVEPAKWCTTEYEVGAIVVDVLNIDN